MAKHRTLNETSAALSRSESVLTSTIEERLARKDHVDVMEVGFGHGHALAELAWNFRDASVRLHGVELSARDPIHTAADIYRVACERGLIPDEAAQVCPAPTIEFYDASRLRMPDESLDLLYSVLVVRFMEDKIGFLEDVGRVLKPGGVAIVQIGEKRWDYPHSRAEDSLRMTPHVSRIVLRHEQELIPLDLYCQLFESDRFEFEWINRPRCVLKVTKRMSANLDFGLSLNRELTVPMEQLPHRHGSGKPRHGIRSVYDVPAAKYQALVEAGMLNPAGLC